MHAECGVGAALLEKLTPGDVKRIDAVIFLMQSGCHCAGTVRYDDAHQLVSDYRLHRLSANWASCRCGLNPRSRHYYAERSQLQQGYRNLLRPSSPPGIEQRARVTSHETILSQVPTRCYTNN